MALQFASPELQADRSIVLAAVQNDGDALEFASEPLRRESEVILDAAITSDSVLQCDSDRIAVPLEFQLQNPDVVENVVQKKASALQHATPEHKKNKKIVQAALRADGDALQYADPELRSDKDTVILALQHARTAGVLKWAADQLREDRAVVLAAVTKKGSALRYAKGDLRNDRDIVLKALSDNPNAYTYASAELKKDQAVLKAAVNSNELQRQIAQCGPAAIFRELATGQDDDSKQQKVDDSKDDETAKVEKEYRAARDNVLRNIKRCIDAKGHVRQYKKQSMRLVDEVEDIQPLLHALEKHLANREVLEKLSKVVEEAYTLLQKQFKKRGLAKKMWRRISGASKATSAEFVEVERQLAKHVRALESGAAPAPVTRPQPRASADSDEDKALKWLQEMSGEKVGQMLFDQAKATYAQRQLDIEKERKWAESMVLRLRQEYKEEIAAAEKKGEALKEKDDQLRAASEQLKEKVDGFMVKKNRKSEHFFNIETEARANKPVPGMKREKYAKRLAQMGLQIKHHDQDVFHIIANKNGGADHPYLYDN